MKCPFCHNGENRVIDSRISKDGSGYALTIDNI